MQLLFEKNSWFKTSAVYTSILSGILWVGEKAFQIVTVLLNIRSMVASIGINNSTYVAHQIILLSDLNQAIIAPALPMVVGVG